VTAPAETDPTDVQSPTVYLYGLVPAGTTVPAGLAGVHGEPVRAVPAGQADAIVSDLADPDVVGTPAEVRAHAAVLDGLAERLPVLPVRFGTVVLDVGQIAAELAPEGDETYAQQLDALTGVVQLSVRARYVRDTIMAELLADEPEIRRLREATQGRSEDATYYDRIRLGELVVGGFERKRAADAGPLESALQPFAVDLRPRQDLEVEDVLDVAVLVRRDQVSALEEALERVAAATAGRINIRLVGPQAPYDFVEQ
jgi:hypothetical protein